jgi:radical SAM protein with 4Fe4S-binding SPASM domain
MKLVKKIPGTVGTLKRHLIIFWPRLTFSRIINTGIMGIEMFFKRLKLISKPVVAKIEASSACNLRCRGCRTGEPLVEYKIGNLAVSDFEVILNKMGKYLFELVFYIWGEPLINKDLPELIKAAHKRNISVIISTNLHFLTEDMGAKLLDAGLDKMIFCIDGWSSETYSEIRIKGNFDLVKANIKRFIDQRKAAKSKKPYLEWQYVVTTNNKSELPIARRVAADWGVEKFTELVDWAKRLEEKDYFKGLDKVRHKMYTKINRCFWLWSSIAIQYDGNVFPCCHVANKPHENRIYGNILKEDLKAVWNSDKYQRARLLLKSKRSINDGDFICKHCYSPPIFIEGLG